MAACDYHKRISALLLLLGVGLASTVVAIGAGVVKPQPAEAAFPGKNGKIAFTSNRTGVNEIYALNNGGIDPKNLTLSSAAWDYTPRYSPSGKSIVFASSRDGNTEIYRMSATGALQTRLTKNVAFDNEPTNSPDGKKNLYENTTSQSGSRMYFRRAASPTIRWPSSRRA